MLPHLTGLGLDPHSSRDTEAANQIRDLVKTLDMTEPSRWNWPAFSIAAQDKAINALNSPDRAGQSSR